MAKVKQIWVSVGMTKSAGNYQSAKADEGILIELEAGENESEVRKKARDYMREVAEHSVNSTIKTIKQG